MPWILLIIVENWKRAMHCVTTRVSKKFPPIYYLLLFIIYFLLFIYLQSEWRNTRYFKYRKYQNLWMNNKVRGD